MSPQQPVDQLAQTILGYTKEQCIHELRSFRDIPLDFTDEWMERTSVEMLRHILMAAYTTSQRYHKAG